MLTEAIRNQYLWSLWLGHPWSGDGTSLGGANPYVGEGPGRDTSGLGVARVVACLFSKQGFNPQYEKERETEVSADPSLCRGCGLVHGACSP
jgi:hypothetical protein